MGVFIFIVIIVVIIIIIANSNKKKEEERRIENARLAEIRRKQEEERRRQEEIRKQKLERERAERIVKLSPTFKTDWQNFQRVLQEKGVTKLYHFTDRANLQSIKANGGLCSWKYCERNGIMISRPGSTQSSRNLDSYKGLENYVRVSFVSDNPMMYVAEKEGRIYNPVVLEISPEVIFKKETKFTNQNAVKNGVTAFSSFEQFKFIRFDLFHWRYFDLDDDVKSYYQAEVLVLDKIPLEFITNIDMF